MGAAVANEDEESDEEAEQYDYNLAPLKTKAVPVVTERSTSPPSIRNLGKWKSSGNLNRLEGAVERKDHR